jgi:hypothetical protein
LPYVTIATSLPTNITVQSSSGVLGVHLT